LEKGINFDEKLVNKKLEQYKRNFDRNLFLEAIVNGGKNWDLELKNLLNSVPDFETAKKQILSKLRKS